MIIIRMAGGLERQMFQYALYMKLTSLGKEVKFDDIDEYRDERTRPIMLSVFDLDYPRATWDEINMYLDQSRDTWDRIRRIFRGKKTKVYTEQGSFDPSIFEMDDIYIQGRFMTQRYFEDILPAVKRAYTFPSVENLRLPRKSNENFLIYYDEIMKSNSVGLHIRRSDSRYNEERYQNICTNEYYKAAVRYIIERNPDAKFFIFSNEPKWIKGWVKEIGLSLVEEGMDREALMALKSRFVTVEASDEYTAYLDMFLLSKCKHHILSNSTFSWWGAWMNENPTRIVVAPNVWVNGEDSSHIYTEGMVLIDSKGRVDKKVK